MSKKPQPNDAQDDQPDMAAADYVLGVMGRKRRRAFEARLEAEPALRSEVAFWQKHAATLAEFAAPVAPRPALFRNIEAALDGDPPPGTLTIRADDGVWRELRDGVFKKSLLLDPAAGVESYLLRLDPGAVVPAHSHGKFEECLVVEGETTIGLARFKAGDFHAVPPNVAHLSLTTDTGALLFIRGEIRDDGRRPEA